MSVEELKADMGALQARVADLAKDAALATSAEVVKFLKNELVPFLENHVNETADIDEGLSDLYNQAEDLLQEETGALFAAVIASAAGLITVLEQRLTKDETDLVKGIAKWRELAKEASQTLSEIVIHDPPEDEAFKDGEDDDEDDEDDDDDDDEDDEDDDDEKPEEK